MKQEPSVAQPKPVEFRRRICYTLSKHDSKEDATVLRIAVCDDEQLYLDKTRAMLEQYAAEHDAEITAEAFVSPSVLLDSIESGEHYDIYLLYIYMPGVFGMSVATELRSRRVRSPIIFLTSSTEHAVEAFGVDATHYLLKPYTQQNSFSVCEWAIFAMQWACGAGLM